MQKLCIACANSRLRAGDADALQTHGRRAYLRARSGSPSKRFSRVSKPQSYPGTRALQVEPTIGEGSDPDRTRGRLGRPCSLHPCRLMKRAASRRC